MRIAQIAPLYEAVPPKMYGGTERIVSYLTEELVARGHEVTLFASGDSVTKARLVSPWCCSLRLQDDCIDQVAHHFTMLEMVQKELHNFDILHYHIDYFHFPLSRRNNSTHVTTLHGRLDIPDIKPLYEEYNDMPLISISNDQRKPLKNINWVDTVYHGLPKKSFVPSFREGKYLAFVGRISPEKRVDRAIEIAIQAGIPIKIAAKIGKNDEEYFNTKIRHLFDHPLVDYVGEITEKEKSEFFGNAIALMFLIDWPEPFGLVMIESMACGTPVIAYNHGSVTEVIQDGVTGFIVNSQAAALNAVKKVSKLDRKKIRNVFDERFSASVMAEKYIEKYEDLINLKLVSSNKFIAG